MMKSIKKLFSFQFITDLRMYIEWIKVIKEEKNNPKSFYNINKFSHNFFYIIYTIFSLKAEEVALPEKLKKYRLMEMLAPINRYLDEELGFADYLVPEINEFYDDNDKPTLDYGIIYRFAFKRLSFKWIVYRLIFWSLLIGSLLHYFL